MPLDKERKRLRERVSYWDKPEESRRRSRERNRLMYSRRKSDPVFLQSRRENARRSYYRAKKNRNLVLRREGRTLLWKILNKYSQTSKKIIPLIGCTASDFRKHLKRRFRRGMSFDNYASVWEMDHIKPVSLFDLSKEDQKKKCFHFTNIRPLFVGENRSFKKASR